MSKKWMEKAQAMITAADTAYVIANELNVEPALRLAKMQASKAIRSRTTLSSSSAIAE